MKLFSNCSGPCETCKTHHTGGCLAGHGDDEYVHADPEWLEAFTHQGKCARSMAQRVDKIILGRVRKYLQDQGEQ